MIRYRIDSPFQRKIQALYDIIHSSNKLHAARVDFTLLNIRAS